MPASELLRRVRARESAYEAFHPQWFWEVEKISPKDVQQFEVADGVWGFTEHVGDNPTFRKLRMEELVSPEYEGGRWELTREDLGLEATDFAYWLGMDALILMEMLEEGELRRMHFRRLEVNEPHPLAAVPYMDFRHEEYEVWENCNTVSYEERVAMLFSDFHQGVRRRAIIILDWRLGLVLLPYTLASDITFLTKDLIILAHNTNEYDGCMTFEVWSLDAGHSLGFCKLPLPADGFRVWFLSHPASKHSGSSPTKHARLFVPDPLVEILGMVFQSNPTELGAQGKTVTVALSIPSFLKKIELLKNQVSEANPDHVPVLEWDDWGPSVTRWLPDEIHGNVGIRTTFGSRMLSLMIIPVPEGEVGIPWRGIVLLDFNPRPIARGSVDVETTDYTMEVIKHETIWSTGDIDVFSSLPYRAWLSNRRCGYSSFFLDGNTIIGSFRDMYHCFSFLPRTEPDDEDAIPYRRI